MMGIIISAVCVALFGAVVVIDFVVACRKTKMPKKRIKWSTQVGDVDGGSDASSVSRTQQKCARGGTMNGGGRRMHSSSK